MTPRYIPSVRTGNRFICYPLKRFGAALAHGYQFRSGLVDLDTLYSVFNVAPCQCWAKFKPIIDEYRWRGIFAKSEFRDFEYLAGEMAKKVARTDPSYRSNPGYSKPEDWENAFLSPKAK